MTLTGHNVDRLARGQHRSDGMRPSQPKELRMSLSYLNIAPLGTRLDGRPIWSFAGAAPDGGGDGGGGEGGDGDGDGDGDGGNEPDPESTEGLKKALERERDANKQKSRELRGFKTLMRETGTTKFDEFKAKVTGGSGTGTKNGGGQQQQEVDLDQIRAEAKAEAKAEADAAAAKSITEAKIEAMATKGFATPRDAVLVLRDDLEDLITDDGKPDVKAIDRALAGLLKDRPHWKKDGTTGATDYDGGSRQTAPAGNGFSARLRDESRKKRGQ